jgi:catabolite regulation protein CreA
MLEVGVERMVRVLVDKSDASLRCPQAATFELDPPVIVVVSMSFRAKAGNLLLTSDR